MSGLPDPISRRDLLHDPKKTAAEKTAIGDAYFAAGRFNEAMDFYAFAANRPGAEKIKRLAIDQGDAFLLGRAAEALGEGATSADPPVEPRGGVTPEDWRNLAARAIELGKFRFAIRACERAGDEEGATRARELLDQAMAAAKAEEDEFAVRRVAERTKGA